MHVPLEITPEPQGVTIVTGMAILQSIARKKGQHADTVLK